MATFLIRELQAGPGELRAQLPVTATVLRTLPGPHGRGEFWCARLGEPVKYRFGGSFDTSRCQPEFLGQDPGGPFLWVQIIVVSPRTAGQRLTPGMRGVAVDLAYVVDLTLGQDNALDPGKVEYVAVADVDDQPTPLVAPEEIASQLDAIVSALSRLTGQHPGDSVPTPVGPDGPQGRRVYEIGPNALRYYSDQGTADWTWRSTTDPDELMYWIADDLVRRLAWNWTQEAPAAALMDDPQVRDQLWIPYWVTLMTALNAKWGERTRGRLLS